jgi:8-oxo-dGTP pyrophosphatase MutT (NUDIX family)
MFTIQATGNWKPGQLSLIRARESSRRIVPEVERLIEETWTRETGRPGVHLFDGPMCRLESFDATSESLRLVVSLTSFKPFAGTNLHNPHIAATYGRDVLANPVGVSTLLETSDGFLMLGRRNASVAYYPGRVHPFAGTIDPDDGDDPFNAAFRELSEELGLGRGDVAEIRCVGLVENVALLQPELVFIARSKLSRGDVERRVDRSEHDETWSADARTLDVRAACSDLLFTPVAAASLTLWENSQRT